MECIIAQQRSEDRDIGRSWWCSSAQRLVKIGHMHKSHLEPQAGLRKLIEWVLLDSINQFCRDDFQKVLSNPTSLYVLQTPGIIHVRRTHAVRVHRYADRRESLCKRNSEGERCF